MSGADRAARGGAGAPRMASLTAWNLSLSLRIPVGSGLEGDERMLRVRLPLGGTERRDPTWAIRLGEPEETGEGWFADFRNVAVARMTSAVDGFELLGRDDFVLSSFVDVTAVRYRRRLPDGEVVAQLQAYLWANSYRMYVVDAATATDTEDTVLPVFDAILRSVRLLPER